MTVKSTIIECCVKQWWNIMMICDNLIIVMNNAIIEMQQWRKNGANRSAFYYDEAEIEAVPFMHMHYVMAFTTISLIKTSDEN